jgi:hypothetical protein
MSEPDPTFSAQHLSHLCSRDLAPQASNIDIMGSTAASAPPSGLKDDVLLIVFPFAKDEEWLARLREQHPGLEVRWAQQPPTFEIEPLPKETYDGVTLLCALGPHPYEMLQKVRFVQLLSAGADRWVGSELYKKPEVTFCTTNGAHA